MMVRPPTLADIAREAGTSASTASRALSGRGYVSSDARARLLDVAERLGYVPNASARTLKQRTSRVVGVVVSDLGNQFYAALAAGIEQTLREAHYQMVLVGDNSQSAEEVAGARTFAAMRAPGVIMTPVGHDAAGLLAAQGVAVVEVDRRVARVPCDAVVLDNEGGARDATAHLLALGHRRIGLLMAKTNWSSDAGRLAGYLSAHEDAHVPVDEKLIVEIEFQAADAGARIAALLAEAAPTALFAGNNVLAELAWHAIRKRGLSIPGDISVVAFDDMAWMGMVQPGITAVAQPTFAMGCRAALLLLRRLEAPLSEQTVEVLEPTLVLRGSTAEPVAIS
jgi:LacI family transcriptional regulator, galactose operon repressor